MIAEPYKNRKEDNLFEKFILEENEEFNNSVVIIDGEGEIKGEIKGDLVAIFSKIYLDGQIDGNVVLIACKADVKNASVEGDFVSISTYLNGKVKRCSGNVVNVNLAFLRPFIWMLKPAIRNHLIKKKKKVKLDELVIKKESRKDMTGVELEVDRLVVDGYLKIDSVSGKEVIVSGVLKAGAVNTSRAFISGKLSTGAINTEYLELKDGGKIRAGAVNTDELIVDDLSSITSGAVNADRWDVKGKINSPTWIFSQHTDRG